MPLPIGLCAVSACILDVAAYKPGNVSLVHDHADMTGVDFLLSAAAIAPVMDQAPMRPIGDTILESIRATRSVTNANTNLGIVLLLAPLASVPPNLDLRGGLIRALMRLTVADAKATYEAIRLANPGGLGTTADQDVAGEPTMTLREVMGMAADGDLVARQYVSDFEQVFEVPNFCRVKHERRATGLGPRSRSFTSEPSRNTPICILPQYGLELAREVSRQASDGK